MAPGYRPDRRGRVHAAGGGRTQEPWCVGHLFACVDGLKGFTKAIETVFPKTPYSMVRRSLNFVSWKLRKAGGTTGRALCRF